MFNQFTLHPSSLNSLPSLSQQQLGQELNMDDEHEEMVQTVQAEQLPASTSQLDKLYQRLKGLFHQKQF